MAVSLELMPHSGFGMDRSWIEEIILNLADAFDVRVVWNNDTAMLTGTMALAGGLLGGYAGGRVGAAIGAGIGGVTGLSAGTAIALREIWIKIKSKLEELFYIVWNFLRRLDAVDYINAVEILMTSYASRRELVYSILEFIGHKLGRQVISSLASA